MKDNEQEILKNESKPDQEKDKGYWTEEDLINDLKRLDPNFNPNDYNNVVRIRPAPDISLIKPIYVDDLLADKPKPQEFIFTPCMPVQGIGFVYAPTGVGKTLFTLNLAYAIAQGGQFLKYVCDRPRKVLYVDGEMSYIQIYNRLEDIKRQQGELDFKNLAVLTPDKVQPARIPKLDDPVGQEIYVKLMQEHDFEVIIFDNFSVLTSIDENKAHEWKGVQDFELYLRSIGKSIINVHHAGKGGDYRGTSSLLDYSNFAISLEPVNENDLEDDRIKNKRFNIRYKKARDFWGADALTYEVQFENGRWSYQSTEKTELEKVIELLALKMKQRDIAVELKLSLGKVNKLIKKGRELKLIRD